MFEFQQSGGDGECINCGEVGNWCKCDEDTPQTAQISLEALHEVEYPELGEVYESNN